MEELGKEDFRLVTDPEELQSAVVIPLRHEILQLEFLHREQRNRLRQKRQREINAMLRRSQEKDETSAKRSGLLAIKSRLEAELKVMKEIKPTVNENITIANLNIEREFKETSKGLNTLIEVGEEQTAELKATSNRLDIVTNRDKMIAEALQVKIGEEMQKLATGSDERTRHRTQVVKTNVRKVKNTTVETWDKLAEFLHTNFPPVPRNEQNASMPRQYVQLSDTIQQLMNAHTSKIDNSYLKISDTWYPPYVKMLLGRGICVQDPKRPDHIRLESYV